MTWDCLVGNNSVPIIEYTDRKVYPRLTVPLLNQDPYFYNIFEILTELHAD